MNSRILGMGNALVDIVIKVDDSFIDKLGFKKGSMNHVDLSTRDRILENASGLAIEQVTGGSVANSISGLAELGVETGYIGKLGYDKNGEFFSKDMKEKKIKTFFKYGSAGTGTAICMITDDSERTFATYLGAAIELEGSDLIMEEFDQTAYFFLEGYMVQNHSLVERSVKMAKEAGNKIIVDLASFNVVEENREFLINIVKDYIDILFANEEESSAFSGYSDPLKALEFISELCDTAVIKLGANGSAIKKDGFISKISAEKSTPVDTTGAGDLFAAGFLFGLVNNMKMETCGKIGSILGKEIVETYGAKIPSKRWADLKSEISKLN